RKEVDVEDVAPGFDIGVHGAEPAATRRLRRDRGVVHQRMQFVVLQPLTDLGNRACGVGMIGEVDLDVILRSGAPWADFRKRMPRAGDDAPAGGGKPDRGRVTDAAAGAGRKQGTPRRIGCRGHAGLSISVMPGLVPGIHVLSRRAGRKSWMAGSSYTKTRFALEPGHDDHFKDTA